MLILQKLCGDYVRVLPYGCHDVQGTSVSVATDVVIMCTEPTEFRNKNNPPEMKTGVVHVKEGDVIKIDTVYLYYTDIGKDKPNCLRAACNFEKGNVLFTVDVPLVKEPDARNLDMYGTESYIQLEAKHLQIVTDKGERTYIYMLNNAETDEHANVKLSTVTVDGIVRISVVATKNIDENRELLWVYDSTGKGVRVYDNIAHSFSGIDTSTLNTYVCEPAGNRACNVYRQDKKVAEKQYGVEHTMPKKGFGVELYYMPQYRFRVAPRVMLYERKPPDVSAAGFDASGGQWFQRHTGFTHRVRRVTNAETQLVCTPQIPYVSYNEARLYVRQFLPAGGGIEWFKRWTRRPYNIPLNLSLYKMYNSATFFDGQEDTHVMDQWPVSPVLSVELKNGVPVLFVDDPVQAGTMMPLCNSLIRMLPAQGGDVCVEIMDKGIKFIDGSESRSQLHTSGK